MYLISLYLSVGALIAAIGVQNEIKSGEMEREQIMLVTLGIVLFWLPLMMKVFSDN